MVITPNIFNVTVWDVDNNFFNSNIMWAKIRGEFGAGSIVGVPKHPAIALSMFQVGVQWHYEIFYDNKSRLKYIVQDDYWATLNERNNDKGDLIKMIKSSYQKVTDEFNERIKTINTNLRFNELSQLQIDVTL